MSGNRCYAFLIDPWLWSIFLVNFKVMQYLLNDPGRIQFFRISLSLKTSHEINLIRIKKYVTENNWNYSTVIGFYQK